MQYYLGVLGHMNLLYKPPKTFKVARTQCAKKPALKAGVQKRPGGSLRKSGKLRRDLDCLLHTLVLRKSKEGKTFKGKLIPKICFTGMHCNALVCIKTKPNSKQRQASVQKSAHGQNSVELRMRWKLLHANPRHNTALSVQPVRVSAVCLSVLLSAFVCLGGGISEPKDHNYVN